MELAYERDLLLPEISRVTISEKYRTESENSPQETFLRAAVAFADNDNHAERLYTYASKLWFGFASPILSNGGTDRGLPISCFLNFVPDSLAGLEDHYAENIWLSTMGGGIGGCWDEVRSDGMPTSRGNESTGIIPFCNMVNSQMLAFKQGKSRRGKYSFNLSIRHPEIEEFIELINKKGGDLNRKALHSFNCVSIPDEFMEALATDSDWELRDPKYPEKTKTIRAWDLWKRILTSRIQEGQPYIHYIDHSNRAMPQSQKDKGLRINQTNLCSEIVLPTNENRTAVCCLSSVNLELYDEWKSDPLFIGDLIRMLDNVLQYFIDYAPSQLHKAVYSATQERSLGLGAMGWHSYLQKHHIPFESAMATSATHNIFKHIKSQAVKASLQLAKERGPCPDSEGMQERPRNMNLLAIAPNATSSIICGNTSPSIEPLYSNYFSQNTQNGWFERKNTYLMDILETFGQNTKEVWDSIMDNGGSVQHLDFLDIHTKLVYKTAFEIKQEKLIDQAAHRQEYVCQAMSLNLFVPPDVDKTYLHAIHYFAWMRGIKTLYYVRSKAPRKADNVGKQVERTIRIEHNSADSTVGEVGYESSCLSCEG